MAKAKLTVNDFPVGSYLRTCQECGNTQIDVQPKEQGVMTKAYQYRACKYCKSEALDYGSHSYYIIDIPMD